VPYVAAPSRLLKPVSCSAEVAAPNRIRRSHEASAAPASSRRHCARRKSPWLRPQTSPHPRTPRPRIRIAHPPNPPRPPNRLITDRPAEITWLRPRSRSLAPIAASRRAHRSRIASPIASRVVAASSQPKFAAPQNNSPHRAGLRQAAGSPQQPSTRNSVRPKLEAEAGNPRCLPRRHRPLQVPERGRGR